MINRILNILVRGVPGFPRFISMHQILGWIINFERFDPLVQQLDFLV
jgi:hypothetical protein